MIARRAALLVGFAACGRLHFDAIGDAGTDGAPPLGPVASFGLGARHACALDAAGAIYCWGDNDEGQLGLGMATPLAATPTRVGTAAWSALAVGGAHTCALANGIVSCWGRDLEGEAVGGVAGAIATPMPVALAPNTTPPAFERIAAGGEHSCAIGAGELWCWGATAAIGDGDVTVSFATQIEPSITDWTEVSLGTSHGCAISATRGVLCWGQNDSAQAAPGSANLHVPTPMVVGLPGGLAPLHVFARNESTCAIASTDPAATAGQLWCWGASPTGTLSTPTQIGTDAAWTAIAMDSNGACGIDGGQATCWGAEYIGGLGDGFWSNNVPLASAVALGPADQIERAGAEGALASTAEFGCLRAGSQVSCWGDNGDGELGQGKASRAATPVLVPPPATNVAWTAIVSGDVHACAAASDAHLYCWGFDGDGSVTAGVARGLYQPCLPGQPCDAPTPQLAPAGIATPDDLVAGFDYTCVRESTVVHCWGRYQEGELGIASPTDDAVTTVTASSGWIRLLGGRLATCGVTGANELDCWGSVASVATFVPTTPSVTLLAGQTIQSVGFGGQSGCAVYGGARLCWGGNVFGTLGDGTTTDDANPAVPQEASGIVAVQVSDTSACELTAAGNVRCWGLDSNGVTGQAGGGETLAPALVSDASGPLGGCTALGLENETGCAICGGVVECWGYNADGELGRGVTSAFDPVAAPVALPPGKTWTSLVVGDNRSCALDSLGELYCWGDGPYGELGDGSQASNLPLVVGP
ncbi:MAG TPA: hypothetical protein VMJ10_34190 [Kofleriaceae bacterium]|nr:hypothetical protein [Kofleriaceae bacterium]